MIRKPKDFKVGTLVSHKSIDYELWLDKLPVPWMNGIIVESDEEHYFILWNDGQRFRVMRKVFDGFVKSGRMKILSET